MANATDRGLFLPISTRFDTGYIHNMNVNNKEFKEFLVELQKTIKDVITVLNKKSSGMHPTEEFVTGRTYFPDPTLNSTTARLPTERQEYCTTIIFGALPNTATKSVAHGIVFPTSTNVLTAVRVVGAATDPIAQIQIPIPYASPVLVNNIEINFDLTNVNITTGSDRTAFTDCKVELRYLKD